MSRLYILFLLFLISCGESSQRETVTELAVIVSVDVDEDSWGPPQVQTLVITENGHMDMSNRRIGVVGDTLEVQVIYIDGEFKRLTGDLSTVVNLSSRFNGR